jgi:hypothetical protein
MEPKEIIDLIRQANVYDTSPDKVKEAAKEYAGEQEIDIKLRDFGSLVNGYVTVKGADYTLGFFKDRELIELFAKVWTKFKLEELPEERRPFWFKEAKSYPLIQDELRNWRF